MYRDRTKGSIAKGLIWFALTGPVGEVGIRIAIPIGWCLADFADCGYYLRRRKGAFAAEFEEKGVFLMIQCFVKNGI